ncbi:MAG: AMP-binding protein, partial [Deltaproteobacteria bacterium]|nr:AMP-binding protein [Deltaproteobacteria bacterium]
GDVVAIHLPQRPETAIAHIGCYRLGAIALPISRLFGTDALLYRLTNSAAKVLMLEPESLEKIAPIASQLPDLKHLIVAGGHGGDELRPLSQAGFDDLLSRASEDFRLSKTGAEDPALLMYTSGTTGDPKGVLHAARYVLGHNGIDYSYNFLRNGDLYYSPADWAWAGGLLDGLLAIWPYGIPVLAYRSKARFDPDVMLHLVQKYGATIGLYPPTVLKGLREIRNPRQKYPDLRLRCVVSGAEPVSPELARWVDEQLRVEFNQAFGQTEANYFIGNCSVLEKPILEPLGKAYPGHEVAILADGQPVKAGETGEIAIRRDSPVVMKEYWRNPGAMGDKFAGEWCLTGDMGHVDEQGYIYFQGRNDDVIKTSGYRVGPAEVEAKIIEHPAVASCAVIGVPDERRGQTIKAFLKLLPGHNPSQNLVEEIQQHVKQRLAAHEYPREFEFIDEFPMTVTGKIRRRDLRDRELQKRP